MTIFNSKPLNCLLGDQWVSQAADAQAGCGVPCQRQGTVASWHVACGEFAEVQVTYT
jgi:hypothetical protein